MRIEFPAALHAGRLIRRYKRFLADVELEQSHEIVTAHCVNTGKMSGCAEEGCTVWLEPAPPGSKRKLQWTWVMSRRLDGVMVGVHTGYPNRLAAGALLEGLVPSLCGYASARREVKMGDHSRVDVLLEGHASQPACWVEVKNVTLVESGVALFPDAVTARGRKHLVELTRKVASGERASMLYIVQRLDAESVMPADAIDPEYGQALRQAMAAGVEAYALSVRATPTGLDVVGELPVAIPDSP